MNLYTIGAEDMTISKYRSIADDIASKSSVPYGVLAFKKNNVTPDVFHFPSAEGANMKYDTLADAPGDYTYLYLFRDNKPIDEGYFTATSTHETRFETKKEVRKERVGTGWILGGVLLGMLGLAAGFRQRKG